MNKPLTTILGLSTTIILGFTIASVIGIQDAAADSDKIWKFFKQFTKKADFVAKMDTSQIPDSDRFPGGDTSLPPLFDDRGKTGMAKFSFDEDLSKLEYTLKFEGLDLTDPTTASSPDDITKIHFHGPAAVGVPGPHVLNVYGAPCEADLEMSYLAATSSMTGAWDDRDVTTDCGVPEPGATNTLTENLEALCKGEIYVNIHTNQNSQTDSKGEIRGQIEPTKQGERICKSLGFD